jgi:hypothetical protein
VTINTKTANMHATTREPWLEYLVAGDRNTSINRKLTYAATIIARAGSSRLPAERECMWLRSCGRGVSCVVTDWYKAELENSWFLVRCPPTTQFLDECGYELLGRPPP